ncbi:hypothetical protein F4779DRAFT_180280 [Xylariaceae sp. FL0662B]|nr:hypothetical protein F4779DRAFT_180280 [Xylariaceae sp. FL0662B]
MENRPPSIEHGLLPYPSEETIPAGPNPGESYQPNQGRPLITQNITTNEDPYAFLKHFDTAFLIDDSASMKRYWDEVGALLKKIAPICTKHDSNGIDVYFINHRPRGYYVPFTDISSGYRNIGLATGMLEMHDNVAGIFHNVTPRGKCKLDRRLGQILDSYVYEYDLELRWSGGQRTRRPLNLIVITAGETNDNPSETLIRTAQKLDELHAPLYQVGVQIFQIGNDEEIHGTMTRVDDELGERMGVRDMIDTVTWSGQPGELSSDAVLKVVLGAVKRSIDKKQA